MALAVNAGSVLERDDERGFAHFAEHMAFQGTERFPKTEIVETLRSMGSRFGANLNAYTSYNETVYYFDIPVEVVDGKKLVPSVALDILDDWSYAVSFNNEDVENERRVVLEEIRTRLGVQARQRRIMFPILFKGSAYEDRDVIGLAETIESASAQQLKDFYDRWYTSDNMALVFIGDFDGKALEEELVSHFNKPAPQSPVNRNNYRLPEPVNGNFHVEIVTDPELTAASFDIFYKQRNIAERGTLAYYRNTLIDILINTMLSQRLEEAKENPEAAATSYYGNIWYSVGDSRFYIMATTPKTGRAEQALIELLTEKESMRRFGFTENELLRAKIALVSNAEQLLSEKDRTDSRRFMFAFTSHFLFGEDNADIEWEVNAVKALLPGIDLNEITRAVNNYFDPNDAVVFLFAPQSEADSLPSEERIRAIFRETQNARLEQRAEIELSSDLIDRLPAPGTIVSETIDVDTGAQIFVLSNGARVIIQDTENRNNEIIMYAMAKGGRMNADEETIVSVSLLAEMLNASGLGNYSRTELINKLTGKQVSFSFVNSNYHRGFQGSSTVQDLSVLFEMIHIFFTNPRLDERAVSVMIEQYKTSLINQEENPQRFFSRELTRILNNHHPMFMPLELDDMEKVSINDAWEFLMHCINPSDYTFIFTGNIDKDIIRQLSALYIGSIPQNTSMNKWTDPGVTITEPGRRTIYKGIDDRCTVYISWNVPAPNIFDEQKSQVSGVLTEYLNIVLNDEIREKLGGVYSISGGASFSVIPIGDFWINAMFVCNPERAEELIAAVKECISDIFINGVNMDTFNKAKEALLMVHRRSLQQNLHIAQSYANSFVLYNTSLNRLYLRPDSIRNVTADNVRDLCREILAIDPILLIMLPEARNTE